MLGTTGSPPEDKSSKGRVGIWAMEIAPQFPSTTLLTPRLLRSSFFPSILPFPLVFPQQNDYIHLSPE